MTRLTCGTCGGVVTAPRRVTLERAAEVHAETCPGVRVVERKRS